MSIPIVDVIETEDIAADPGAAPTGTTRVYTKSGMLYTEAPDTTVVGPAQFGLVTDIQPTGGSAVAGTSGRVADAAHVHVGSGGGGGSPNLDGGLANSTYGGIAALDAGGA